MVEERQDMSARERKRQQNRLAQRTYRQNQKQRIRALEGALAQSGSKDCLTPNIGLFSVDDLTSEDQMWSLPTNDNLDSSLSFAHVNLGSPQPETLTEKVPFDPSSDLFTASETSPSLGLPALHRAVFKKNEAIVRLLLEKGADTKRQDSNGLTALHVAVEIEHEGLVKLLLEGNDPNVKDYMGRTALFGAVKAGNDVVTKLLLEASIDVDCKDMLGETALHIAVDNGSESSILLLLKHGANINN